MIADTQEGLRLCETASPPTYYFPPQAIAASANGRGRHAARVIPRRPLPSHSQGSLRPAARQRPKNATTIEITTSEGSTQATGHRFSGGYFPLSKSPLSTLLTQVGEGAVRLPRSLWRNSSGGVCAPERESIARMGVLRRRRDRS